jgi:FAD/FMN-containing dehydrogenase
MSKDCIERVRRHRGLRDPLAASEGAGCYVLIEVEQPERGAAVEEWLQQVVEAGLVLDGALAQTAAKRDELWALREGISETLSATGLPHKNDIALPIAGLEAFCAEMDSFFAARYPGWQVFLFGHIGDGNLHVNVMKPEGMDKGTFLARAREVDAELFALLRRHGGSISAEHGIGLLKKPYLHYSRTEAELAIMRGIKHTLDPRGILNPGKLFD